MDSSIMICCHCLSLNLQKIQLIIIFTSPELLLFSSSTFFSGPGQLPKFFVPLSRNQKFLSPTLLGPEFRLPPLSCAFYQKLVLKIQTRHLSRELLYHITEYSALQRNYSSSTFLNSNTSQPFRGENSLPSLSLRTFEKVNSSSATDGKLKNYCLNNSSCQVPHSESKIKYLTLFAQDENIEWGELYKGIQVH